MDKWCRRCGEDIKEEMYETGMEEYCKCQCTLEPNFNPDIWVGLSDE